MNCSPLADTESGIDNNPFPSLFVPETCTEISVDSKQDEDGSLSLCSQVLFTHNSASTVADAQATPVVESVYVMVYDEADPSMPSVISNRSYKMQALLVQLIRHK